MTDRSHQCVIIGIVGTPVSDKNLIAGTLYRELRGRVGDEHIDIILKDCYHKDQSHLSMEERIKTSYDHPSAMDHSLLLEYLQALKRGSVIDLPVYSYIEHMRVREAVTVEPEEIIILKGILLLTGARLRDRLNLSTFIDTPLDVCLIRHARRDVNKHERPVDLVMAQYQKTVHLVSL